MFNFFFEVKDRYETYIDELSLVPWVFVRRVSEGGYKITQDIYFNRFANTATDLNKQKTYTVPEDIQDLLSSFYYARNFDCSEIKAGEVIRITTFIDFEVYPLKLKFIGREKVKTSIGSVNCLKFMPMLQVGNIFKDKEGMTIWISDDKNHLPILVEADLLVGSIRMELIKYSNLKNNINFSGK